MNESPASPAPAAAQPTDDTTLTRAISRADRLQALIRARDQELEVWRDYIRVSNERAALERELGLRAAIDGWRSPLSAFVFVQIEMDRAFQKRLAETGRES